MKSQQPTCDTLWSARLGDTASQRALSEQWLPTVMRWTARLGGPCIDVEATSQSILIRAFQRLHTLRDPAASDVWLLGLTRRALSRQRRRAWLARWISSAVQAMVNDGTGLEPPEATLAVHRVLDKLPTAAREVMVLCDIEERTAAEAAHLLGTDQGTITRWLHLGRARLAHHAHSHGLRPDPPVLVEVQP